MDRRPLILVLNVGSTSTKVAVFEGEKAAALKNIAYGAEDLAPFATLADQLPLRERDVLGFVAEAGVAVEDLALVVSRGGLGRPAPAGAYGVDEEMCRDLMEGRYGRHPSALGPAMALGLARRFGMPAIVIDAPSTDEFEPLARISGIPEIERKSAFHALNQKAAARRWARERSRLYEEVNLVVAHLGGGITVGAHRRGRVIDCTHGLSEGPLTPERAGALPTLDLLEAAFAAGADRKELQGRLVGRGGLAAYLGTNDARRVEEMIAGGDEKARLVYEAMAYQTAKEIGAMATVLQGDLDGIVLTGGLAHSRLLTCQIEDRVRFLAPVAVYPGEDEMQALAEGGLRVLKGEEEVKGYR
ncbi:MAG TPA: butyrate kinase [Syntrophales bacterium]|nr:butyrate kinase [Syntrophales bacterium]HPC01955.1 butyrate kinase [Syntrophales bacterium]HRS87871.1 butyrate kinase [Syntrophales bacterium]HRV43454.1 butyrate kinase [Syntrophales bacterium]